MATLKVTLLATRSYGFRRRVLILVVCGSGLLAVLLLWRLGNWPAWSTRYDKATNDKMPRPPSPLAPYLNMPIFTPPPVVDVTVANRCGAANDQSEKEETHLMASSAMAGEVGGKVTVLLTTKTRTGGQRTTGGDTFLGYMYRFTDRDGGAIFEREKFDVYASSYDNCNGTYTFLFDLSYVPSGKYSFAAVRLGEKYRDAIKPSGPVKCEADLNGRRVSTENMIKTAEFQTENVFFPSLRVYRTLPTALVTRHLPQCNFNQSASGRWVDFSACMGAEHPCREGPAYLRLADRYIWVPYNCKLRYVPPNLFAARLAEINIKTIALLGDDRAFEIFLALNDYMRNVVAFPKTGLVARPNMARSEMGVHYNQHNREFSNGFAHQSFTAFDINFAMVQCMGSLDQYQAFPCPEPRPMIAQYDYVTERRQTGTLFQRLDELSKSDINPDLLIVQDGGLHDLLYSVNETHYNASLLRLAEELSEKFAGKRVIFMTQPAAYVQDLGKFFYIRSHTRQYRRVVQSAEFFRSRGFEVWDTFPMTFTRGDRYFQHSHFYPRDVYPHKAKAFPKLLGDELVQDLVNRLLPFSS